jgi:hypothetical protein
MCLWDQNARSKDMISLLGRKYIAIVYLKLSSSTPIPSDSTSSLQ